MSCFCKQTPPTFGASLDVAAAADLSASASAQAVLAADARIGFGIPGINPAWLNVPMPQLDASLSVAALASIAATAQLRAQAMAQLGIDLGLPIGINAVIRMMATLNARIEANAPAFDVNLAAWVKLNMLNQAALRVTASATANASLAAVVTPPEFGPFSLNLQGLSLLMQISASLGISLSAVAEFRAAISALAQIRLPALPGPTLSVLAQLSAGLSAVAQLGTSLGIDASLVGIAEIQARVAVNVQAALRVIASISARLNLSAGMPWPTIPGLPFFATRLTMRAAAALDASAVAALSLDAQFAATAGLGSAMATLGFAANASAMLGLDVALRPCPVCDAQALLAAFAA